MDPFHMNHIGLVSFVIGLIIGLVSIVFGLIIWPLWIIFGLIIGLASIVFWLISGYHRRTAGSPFFRFLFKVNVGLYGLTILSILTKMPYGGPLLSGFLLLIFVMPILALAQVIELAIAAGKARKEASSETEGPGAARLGFSSAGLLLCILVIFSFTFSIRAPGIRNFDSDSKVNLHNYFLACSVYWADEGGDNNCSLEIAKQASYGFNQTSGVKIMSYGGNESSFTAFATHRRTESVYKINNARDIEKSAVSPFPPPPLKTRWELFLKNIGVSTVLAG